MKYGVIDIGSNTVKAFVYESENNYEVISSMHRPTKLINYISDAVMSEDGIASAVNDIKDLKAFLEKEGCEVIYSYATSATRDCINRDEIISRINSSCGLDTDVLSGKAEALCDAKGATLVGIPDFLCIDLGGGSAQVCEYGSGELTSAVSWPAGALRTKKYLGGSDFPDDILAKETEEYIKRTIWDTKPSKDNLTAIIMGGASQSSIKVMRSVGVNPDEADKGVFRDVFERLSVMDEEKRSELLMKEAPLRHDILGYALIILDTIINHLRVGKIIFTQKGSREGYLLYKLEGTDFSKIV